jgi:hypothetical protein
MNPWKQLPVGNAVGKMLRPVGKLLPYALGANGRPRALVRPRPLGMAGVSPTVVSLRGVASNAMSFIADVEHNIVQSINQLVHIFMHQTQLQGKMCQLLILSDACIGRSRGSQLALIPEHGNLSCNRLEVIVVNL